MSARIAILIVAGVVLSGIVGAATMLSIDGGSIFFTSEEVHQPSSPDHLKGSFHSSTPTILLTWEGVSDAEEYRIYREPEGEETERIASTDDESYEDTDIQEGERYTYFVTAVPVNGLESEPSNDVTVLALEPTETPTPTLDATPTDSDVTPEATDEADLTLEQTAVTTDDGISGGASLSRADARALGASWIQDHVGRSYDVDGSSCSAAKSAEHWAVTCLGMLKGCQGAVCPREFTVCVFEQPRTRDWC